MTVTTDSIEDCLIGLIEEEGICRQTVIAVEVANELRALDVSSVWYGLLLNGRENGVTYYTHDWVFAVYEHRNSDDIILNGVHKRDLPENGIPYYNDDKNDVLCRTPSGDYEHAATRLALAIETVQNNPNLSRASLKSVVQEL